MAQTNINLKQLDGVRMYFGRIPDSERLENIDIYFSSLLAKNGYCFDAAVTSLLAQLKNDRVYYTCNPLIPNFMDDNVALKIIYFIDESGSHLKLGNDQHMVKKIKVMGPGEALVDDERVLR